MTSKPHHIIVADSQYLITESLTTLIRESDGYRLAGLASNIAELKALLKEHSDIKLLITDFFLIDFNGFDQLKSIISGNPGIKVLILTNQVRPGDINELNRIGVKNILYKTAGPDEIIQAIDTTLQGRKYYCDEVLDLLIDNKSTRDEVIAPAHLTPSEIDITRLIASGLTTKEIAVQKHVSFHTVMSHRKNIFRKLNIKNTSELTRYAIKAGLIDNIEYYI
jgi:DNA-binding NarL/FixJ family response regulator